MRLQIGVWNHRVDLPNADLGGTGNPFHPKNPRAEVRIGSLAPSLPFRSDRIISRRIPVWRPAKTWYSKPVEPRLRITVGAPLVGALFGQSHTTKTKPPPWNDLGRRRRTGDHKGRPYALNGFRADNKKGRPCV